MDASNQDHSLDREVKTEDSGSKKVKIEESNLNEISSSDEVKIEEESILDEAKTEGEVKTDDDYDEEKIEHCHIIRTLFKEGGAYYSLANEAIKSFEALCPQFRHFRVTPQVIINLGFGISRGALSDETVLEENYLGIIAAFSCINQVLEDAFVREEGYGTLLQSIRDAHFIATTLQYQGEWARELKVDEEIKDEEIKHEEIKHEEIKHEEIKNEEIKDVDLQNN